MFDMIKMMGKVKEVQEKVKVVQEELKHKTVIGESGAGMVKATANGHRKIIKIEIDDALSDVEMAKDLIIAAVNQAIEKSDEMAKEAIRKETEGMLPNIPGLDLSGLGL